MIEHSQEDHSLSLGQLLSKLSDGLSRMFRDEVELAKIEMSQKIKQTSRDAVFLLAGGFVGYAGFLVLLGAAVFALAIALPLWLSALIIGIVVSGIAYGLVRKGINDIKKRGLTPERTVKTVKEDVKWAKDQI